MKRQYALAALTLAAAASALPRNALAATRRGGSVTERRSAPAPVRCRPECQLGGDDGRRTEIKT